jgi:hypothetical protein
MRCGHDGDRRRSGALFGGTHSTGRRERFSNAVEAGGLPACSYCCARNGTCGAPLSARD